MQSTWIKTDMNHVGCAPNLAIQLSDHVAELATRDTPLHPSFY